MLLPHIPQFRKRQGRVKSKAAPPSDPINMITSVVLSEDQQTIAVLFSPGTVVTAVNNPDDNFYVNYPEGQTAANFAEIIQPGWVRMVLSDMINAPATWEVDDAAVFSFETGTFAGPFAGDVIFPE
jgi:hypothetical protein